MIYNVAFYFSSELMNIFWLFCCHNGQFELLYRMKDIKILRFLDRGSNAKLKYLKKCILSSTVKLKCQKNNFSWSIAKFMQKASKIQWYLANKTKLSAKTKMPRKYKCTWNPAKNIFLKCQSQNTTNILRTGNFTWFIWFLWDNDHDFSYF